MVNDACHRPAVTGGMPELPEVANRWPSNGEAAAEDPDRTKSNDSASDALSNGPSRVTSLPILPSEEKENTAPSVRARHSSTELTGNGTNGVEFSTVYQDLQAFKASAQKWDDTSNERNSSETASTPVDFGEPGRVLYGRSATVRHPKEVEKKLQRNISLANRTGRLLQLMDTVSKLSRKVTVRHDYRIDLDPAQDLIDESGLSDDEFGGGDSTESPGEDEPEEPYFRPRKLCIAILIVGTRGDVQPFIAIGLKLKEYGHRVRLASHSNYREFVTSAGLEFYPLGGDPKILAEYMVKNKGFLPRWPQEIVDQRKQLRAIINSLHDACTCADKDSGGRPFVANAVIANPPCIAHADIAEYLQVPLHVIFTMPWTPTREFPHPLAHVTSLTGFQNWLSYAVVDNVMWLGTRDLVTKLRRRYRLPKTPPKNHIPYAYIWSPSLAPKPKDWGKLVDICGFCFLDLKNNYTPDKAFEEWLAEGEKPIFIGFGSLPLENPRKMTDIIVRALAATKQRGIIQKGWGGLGDVSPPVDHVYTVGDCPHDWLFPKCKAVVHHGGAGTTAAGLVAGLPTTVVPFFGDQPFWGARVNALGVGPEPIPVNLFSEYMLVNAIKVMLEEKTIKAAASLAEKMSHEDGVESAVGAFHKHLPKERPSEAMDLAVKPSRRSYRSRITWCFGGASD